MSADDLLTGTFNIFVISDIVAGVTALLVLALVIVRAARNRQPLPREAQGLAFATGVGLLVLGTFVCATIAVSPANEDVGGGPIFLIPTLYLAGIAALALLRPAWAGYVLLASSVAVLAVQVGVGVVATRLDPALDISPGIIVVDFGFCLPASLVAILLLAAVPPATRGARIAIAVVAALPVIPALVVGLEQGDVLLQAAVVATLVVLVPALLFAIAGFGGSARPGPHPAH